MLLVFATSMKLMRSVMSSQGSLFNCKCGQIVEEINEKFPGCNWNCDDACEEWQTRQHELEVNDIEVEPYSDEQYACCCPTCGVIICGWCV